MKYVKHANAKPMSAHFEAAFMASKDWLNGWQGETVFDFLLRCRWKYSSFAQAHPNAKSLGLISQRLRIDKTPLLCY